MSADALAAARAKALSSLRNKARKLAADAKPDATAAASTAASAPALSSTPSLTDDEAQRVRAPRERKRSRFHPQLPSAPLVTPTPGAAAAAADSSSISPCAGAAAIVAASSDGVVVASVESSACEGVDASSAAAQASAPNKRTRWSTEKVEKVAAVPQLVSPAAAAATDTLNGATSSALVVGTTAAATDAVSAVAASDPSTAMVLFGSSSTALQVADPTGTAVTGLQRRTRFHSNLLFDASELLSLHPTHLPSSWSVHEFCIGMTLAQADCVVSHLRLEAIDAQLKLLDAGRPLDQVDPIPVDPLTLRPVRARSPSPEPVYDEHGKRSNTRPARLRAALLKLQKGIVEGALQRRPGVFLPPQGYRSSAAGRLRYERKLLIPLEEYPDYNFKGVIIGARGNKQQELEKLTGCKIAVRGKGSWSSSRPDSMRKHYEGDDEPQHCHISADTEEKLAHGVREVKKLLVPMDEAERRKQLHAVAELNGWISLDGPRACRVCGSLEHLMRNCPERNPAFTSASHVSCKLCGSRSHPTLDCPSRRSGGARSHLHNGMHLRDADERVDDEYEQFMAELTADGHDSAAHIRPTSSSIARGADGKQLALTADGATHSSNSNGVPNAMSKLGSSLHTGQSVSHTNANGESFREYRPPPAQPQLAPPIHSAGGWSTTHVHAVPPVHPSLYHSHSPPPPPLYAPQHVAPPPPFQPPPAPVFTHALGAAQFPYGMLGEPHPPGM